MEVCPNCGCVNPEDATTCGSCGSQMKLNMQGAVVAPMPVEPQPVMQQPVVQPAPQAIKSPVLTVNKGSAIFYSILGLVGCGISMASFDSGFIKSEYNDTIEAGMDGISVAAKFFDLDSTNPTTLLKGLFIFAIGVAILGILMLFGAKSDKSVSGALQGAELMGAAGIIALFVELWYVFVGPYHEIYKLLEDLYLKPECGSGLIMLFVGTVMIICAGSAATNAALKSKK